MPPGGASHDRHGPVTPMHHLYADSRSHPQLPQFTFSMASLRDCAVRSVIKVGDMNTSFRGVERARDPDDQARLYPDYQESARGAAEYRIMGPTPPAIEAETRAHG